MLILVADVFINAHYPYLIKLIWTFHFLHLCFCKNDLMCAWVRTVLLTEWNLEMSGLLVWCHSRQKNNAEKRWRTTQNNSHSSFSRALHAGGATRRSVAIAINSQQLHRCVRIQHRKTFPTVQHSVYYSVIFSGLTFILGLLIFTSERVYVECFILKFQNVL